MAMDTTTLEQKAQTKLERRTKKRKKRTRPAGTNPWIDFYMKWREANSATVQHTRDVKALVRLARKEYTPVNKGIICARCGFENQPPFKKAPTN
jgi:hypothetical protein